MTRGTPLLLAALVLTSVGAAVPEPPAGTPPPRASVDENPCITPTAALLRCPNLRMTRPFGLRAVRWRGRAYLRAGNSIDSVGAGPAELRGVRARWPFMRATQRIYARGRGWLDVTTGARVKYVPGHLRKRWWKFHDAARFELWRLDEGGRRVARARVGPKVDYCLRDLRRTHPRLRGAPRRRVYPACSTDPFRRWVTLGTSTGWSDIYPPTYRSQYIDVTGLRGCFAYVHIADPRNVIFESNEDDNDAQVIVRLPYRAGAQRCPGRARGEVNRERGPY